jgi:geranylgeranyl diphosphate synthase, type II
MGAVGLDLNAAAEDSLVAELLADYGSRVRQELLRTLPTGKPTQYLYDLMADYPRRGGKMLRSSLCLATACAFGASLDDALPSAVSIELLHNALLIHDDIEDGSEQRRGSPTLHARYGLALALNAGDALTLSSMRPLLKTAGRIGPARALRILEDAERMAWETAEGQALELGWRHDNRTDLCDDDYFEMVLKKTCWLTTIHPMRVGALIAVGDAAPLDALLRLGSLFGTAFQIQDDLLNLGGGRGYGKEADGDLLEGKRTLMLIHALRQSRPRERQRLLRYLSGGRDARRVEETAWVRQRLVDAGSLAHARTIARGLCKAALYEFEQAFTGLRETRDRAFVRALLGWVQRRLC